MPSTSSGTGRWRYVFRGVSLSKPPPSENGHLAITWAPDRRVLLQHLGEGRFKVVESENSKLKADDSFHCTCFIIGQPLYLDNFIRGNNPPTLFVVGNKGGLTTVERRG